MDRYRIIKNAGWKKGSEVIWTPNQAFFAL